MKIRHLWLVLLALFLTACETTQERKDAFASADYGPAPVIDKAEVENSLKSGLKDPGSAQFRWLEPEKMRWRANAFSEWRYGWNVKIWVNAKNSYGGYTGEQPYWLTYLDGKLVDVTKPWMVPQFEWGERFR